MTELPVPPADARPDAVVLPEADPAGLPLPLVVLGLALYAVAGVLTAVFELLLAPLRHGTTLVPIAVLLAIGTNIALPRLSFQLARTPFAALPPVLFWFLTLAVLVSSRPEGDVILPAGNGVQYVGYGVILGGMFAGVITIALLVSERDRLRQRERADAVP